MTQPLIGSRTRVEAFNMSREDAPYEGHRPSGQRSPGARILRALAILVGGLTGAVAVFSTPPFIYANVVAEPHWDEFWESAATPYGAATAGLFAIIAAALALLNGRRDREMEKSKLLEIQRQFDQTSQLDTERLTQAKSALENSIAQAALDRETAQSEADRRHGTQVVRDLQDRFTTAAEQLAHDSTAVQQAGAYAFASLADDWLDLSPRKPEQAQVCIDVLCTYLRTHHLDKLVRGAEYDYASIPVDQPVRDTIVQIIASHLRATPTSLSWAHLEFDFTGAHFWNADFHGAVFWGAHTSFVGAQFHGKQTQFDYAQFNGDQASFGDAEFHSDVTSFDEAIFHGSQARFDEAQFYGNQTSFKGTRFRSELTYFVEARFHCEQTSFDESKFASKWTRFSEAQFRGRRVSFDGAQFDGEWTRFDSVRFHSGWASFGRVAFGSRLTSFRRVEFGSVVDFSRPEAWSGLRFDWDGQPSGKPETVRPVVWPPTIG